MDKIFLIAPKKGIKFRLNIFCCNSLRNKKILLWEETVAALIPVSSSVHVSLGHLGKCRCHLDSIWLKISLTQLQVVLHQRQ